MSAQEKKAGSEKKNTQKKAPLPKKILDNVPDLIAIVDRDMNIQYTTPSFFNQLGYLAGELTDTSLTAITHPDDTSGFQEELRNLLDGGFISTLSCRLRNKSGNWLIFESTASLIEAKRGEDTIVLVFRDMTIRSQTEAALAASEARYRNLTRVSPVGIFQCNANRFCLFVNERWSELSGISQDTALGEEWMVAIHPDDRLQILDHWHNAIRNKIPFKMEYRFLRPDKSVVWVYGEGTAVMSDSGKVTGYIETIIDITERKRTETALQESERRYRQLVDLSPDTVVVHSEGKILYANAASAEMFGAKHSQEFIGRNVLDFVHPAYRDTAARRIQRLYELQKPGPPVQEKLRTISGKELDAEIVAAPITYMGKAAIQSVVRDISVRVSTEKQMNMLAQAMKSISDCVIITGLDDKILFVNHIFEEIYGYLAEEVTGKSISIIRSENDTPGRQHIHAQTLAGGWQGELLNRRKDGSEFTIFLSSSLIRDSKGEPIAMVGICKDITRQHRTERAQMQTERQLRYFQKMEAVGRLAGGIADDYNNLLTLITGYAQLLLEKPGIPADSQKSLQQILSAGEKAGDLTRQLLAFSRKQVLQPQLLNLNNMLDKMIPDLQKQLGNAIEVHSSLYSGLGHISVDHAQLRFIIDQLIANAREAMPSGGKLTLETANVYWDANYMHLDIAAIESGDYVMLAISDNGKGMDAETLSKIFEPFYSTKLTEKGRGLGLATAYGIIKQSGGYIWAFSEENIGTTFKIYFPQVDAPEAQSPLSKSAMDSQVSGTETVLLLEGNEALRRMDEQILRGRGYQVLSARDGSEAVPLVQSAGKPVHLLIVDPLLPVLKEADLISQLHALHPEMKVLYLSGYPLSTISEHGIPDSENTFLQKPFSPQMLLEKVHQVLNS